MNLDAVELLLRALAGAWAFAAGLALVARTPRTGVHWLGAFCAGGVCAFLAVSTSIVFEELGVLPFMLDAWCLAGPLAFWMLARALFREDAKLSRALVLAAVVVTGVESAADWGRFALGPLWQVPGFAHGLFLALRAASLLLVLHGVHLALAGWRDDLVDARRRVRGVFALLAGGAFVFTVASSILFPAGAPQLVRVPALAALAVAMLAFLLLVATGRLGQALREALPPLPAPRAKPRAVERPDAGLAMRVVQAMEAECLWRRERLTLAELARHLDAPEYRLRRAIHHHLGYRNFAAFLAHYRLEAAAAMLAEAGAEGTSILEVALACGFNSIGPFNRAFRTRFGVTPTGFRAAARPGARADSCNPAPIERFGETARAR